MVRFFRGWLTTPRGWWLICICVAAIVIWPARCRIFSDALNYLDIASEASQGNLRALGNSYWGPAYPAILAIGLALFRPSPAWELPLMQLVNFLIFILALWTFSLFYRVWSGSNPAADQAGSADTGLSTAFAFGSFLWFTASLIELSLSTPDMLVAAWVFGVAALGSWLSRPGAVLKHFAGLGALLGAGIYIKAALLPLSIAFIGSLFLSMRRTSVIPLRRQLVSLGVSTAMCLLVAAPLISWFSVQKGQFSTGDTGRLAYLWYVDELKPSHAGWTGGTPEYGTPLHPPRKLMDDPEVLEFATPIPGTYPLNYSQGYWYAGATPVFNLRKQVIALAKSLQTYLEIPILFFGFDGFLAGAVLLFVLGRGKSRSAQPPRISLWLVAWPLAACAMYSIVLVEWRYVAVFLLLLCLELYRALASRVERRVASIICALVLLVAMAPLGLLVARSLVKTVAQFRHPADEDWVVVAKNLQRLGLKPGDKLASVGKPLSPFYARYDRLQIVAQIEDPLEYWQMNPAEAKLVENRLASIGVKALVALDRPPGYPEPGWKNVGSYAAGSLSVFLLQPANEASR